MALQPILYISENNQKDHTTKNIVYWIYTTTFYRL